MYSHMKLLMGFIFLIVALVVVTGCTQTASPSTQTPAATAVPTTEVTAAATPVPTTVETMAPNTTEMMAANVTAAAANVTAVATTAAMTTTAAPANVTPTPTPASMVTSITFTSAGFVPQTDIVLPGTGVSFVNKDNVSHSVIAIGNNTGMFNSGPILPGGAFSYTFTTNAGTINYALADNPAVNGTIIVQTLLSTSNSVV